MAAHFLLTHLESSLSLAVCPSDGPSQWWAAMGHPPLLSSMPQVVGSDGLFSIFHLSLFCFTSAYAPPGWAMGGRHTPIGDSGLQGGWGSGGAVGYVFPYWTILSEHVFLNS